MSRNRALGSDGYEVPLGQGCLDLKAMIAAVQKGKPASVSVGDDHPRPARHPVWKRSTGNLGRVPGRDLARRAVVVEEARPEGVVPRITGLKPEDQLAAEDRHVRESFSRAAKERLIRG